VVISDPNSKKSVDGERNTVNRRSFKLEQWWVWLPRKIVSQKRERPALVPDLVPTKRIGWPGRRSEARMNRAFVRLDLGNPFLERIGISEIQRKFAKGHVNKLKKGQPATSTRPPRRKLDYPNLRKGDAGVKKMIENTAQVGKKKATANTKITDHEGGAGSGANKTRGRSGERRNSPKKKGKETERSVRSGSANLLCRCQGGYGETAGKKMAV